jgi:hypothetical protein
VWTEAAVARGLRWLAQHQNEDGSWSLDNFHRAGDCNGRCGNRGTDYGHMAATSLALLPYLGAGQLPTTPCLYQETVAKGLRWMVEQQNRQTGDLRADAKGNGGMYVHGQATIVLCEAFAMTGSEALREPAQKAVDFIVRAQHIGGGWRYQPGEPGDTSVIGWQLMALHSARSATLFVPKHTLVLAGEYLDAAESRSTPGLYGYQPNQSPTPAMTAEALLCRFYLGATKHDPVMRGAIYHLVERHPPRDEELNFYYLYYATQAMHHWGGEPWERWNSQMRDVLLRTQETSGHEAGSWATRGHHDHRAGRLYATSLAVCTLEVYYRHAPIFKQIELD